MRLIRPVGVAEWRRAAPLLRPALGPTHAEADVLAGLLAGELHLFLGERAAVVCERIAYPRLLACRVFLAGGELAELRASQAVLEGWARSWGAARLEMAGRPGWERAMGWRRVLVVAVKELRDADGSLSEPGGGPGGALHQGRGDHAA